MISYQEMRDGTLKSLIGFNNLQIELGNSLQRMKESEIQFQKHHKENQKELEEARKEFDDLINSL